MYDSWYWSHMCKIYVHMYICTYVHMYICIYIHTHAYVFNCWNESSPSISESCIGSSSRVRIGWKRQALSMLIVNKLRGGLKACFGSGFVNFKSLAISPWDNDIIRWVSLGGPFCTIGSILMSLHTCWLHYLAPLLGQMTNDMPNSCDPSASFLKQMWINQGWGVLSMRSF